MNYVLCGMMGVGKTTIGKALANTLGFAWADSDQRIVENYGEISAIFEKQGEKYFRDIETETIKALCKKDGLVLSTGGGALLREENVKALKSSGKIIYLRATVATLLSRLQSDTQRPLLQECNLETRLQTLLKERAHAYESAADYTIDVDNKTVRQIVQEIIEKTS